MKKVVQTTSVKIPMRLEPYRSFKSWKTLYCTLVLLILAFSINGQDSLSFSLDPVVSKGKGYDILQTYQSNFWFGTNVGLYFFNGITCEKRDLPIKSNVIRSLHENDEGEIWIATDQGVVKYSPQQNEFTSIFTKENLSSRYTFKVYEDSEKNVWVGSDRGLNKITPDGKVKIYQHAKDTSSLSSSVVLAITEDADKNIWIGTQRGVDQLNLQTGKITHLLKGVSVWSITEIEGAMWIATKQGVYAINIQTKEVKKINNHNSKCVYKDAYQRLWIGTDDGLLLFENGVEQYLTEAAVYSIFRSDDGILWIGALNGVFSLDIQYFHMNKPAAISTIYSDAEHNLFYVGSKNKISLSNGKVFNVKGQVANIFEKLGTSFYTLRSGGVFELSSHKKIFDFTSYATVEEENGVWMASHDGLYFWDNTNRLTLINRPRVSYSNVTLDILKKADEIFLATLGGVVIVDTQSRGYTTLTTENSDLPDDKVSTVFHASDGKIWFGTNYGLCLFKDNDFEVFLNNVSVRAILEDKKANLWISTDKGIMKFDPVNKKVLHIFDKMDGVSTGLFIPASATQLPNGDMLFGGVNGYVRFNPEKITFNTHIPDIVITQFQRKQEVEPIAEVIEINHNDYFFSFDFTALNYRQSEKNQYAYQLEGFDEGWIYTDSYHPRAIYTGIPAGTYTFKAKGANDDGLWNEEGTSVTLIVHPAPWETTWAYCIYTCLLALLGWGVHKAYRKYNHQKDLARREKIAKEEARHLAAQKETEKQKALLAAEKVKFKEMEALQAEFQEQFEKLRTESQQELSKLEEDRQAIATQLATEQKAFAQQIAANETILQEKQEELKTMDFKIQQKRAELVTSLSRDALFSSKMEEMSKEIDAIYLLYQKNDIIKKRLKVLHDIIRDLSAKHPPKVDLEKLKVEYLEKYPNFIKEVKARTEKPLSLEEIIICCYLKDGLVVHEIAERLGTAPRYVTDRKTKLKKRFNIKHRLEVFLEELTSSSISLLVVLFGYFFVLNFFYGKTLS